MCVLIVLQLSALGINFNQPINPMDTSSIISILYFLSMTVICGMVARRLLILADEEDSPVHFITGCIVTALAVFNLCVLVVAIIE
jgi:hypothetical protein